MRGLYILDDDRNVIPCNSILKWGIFMADDANRRVGLEVFGTAEISTVFVGLDHSHNRRPIQIFETALFDDEIFVVIERYATWAEAEAGHAVAVAAVKK